MKKLNRHILFLFAVVALAACDTESSTMMIMDEVETMIADGVDQQEVMEYLTAKEGWSQQAAMIMTEVAMLDSGMAFRVARKGREHKDLDIVRRADLPDGELPDGEWEIIIYLDEGRGEEVIDGEAGSR